MEQADRRQKQLKLAGWTAFACAAGSACVHLLTQVLLPDLPRFLEPFQPLHVQGNFSKQVSIVSLRTPISIMLFLNSIL
jgi:hypothetical protein